MLSASGLLGPQGLPGSRQRRSAVRPPMKSQSMSRWRALAKTIASEEGVDPGASASDTIPKAHPLLTGQPKIYDYLCVVLMPYDKGLRTHDVYAGKAIRQRA